GGALRPAPGRALARSRRSRPSRRHRLQRPRPRGPAAGSCGGLARRSRADVHGCRNPSAPPRARDEGRPSRPPFPAHVIPILTGLGLAAASGLNAWAVLLVFNGLARLLPQDFPGPVTPFLTSPFVIDLALALFLIEFVVNKIPFADRFWE